MSTTPGNGGAASAFRRMWRDLESIGLDEGSGGYHRFAWTREDHDLREAWFAAAFGCQTPTDEPSAVACPPTSTLPGPVALEIVHVPSPVVERYHCAVASGVVCAASRTRAPDRRAT